MERKKMKNPFHILDSAKNFGDAVSKSAKQRPTEYNYKALDKDGIPRVFGYGTNRLEARLQCEIALREYLLRKLDKNIVMYPEDYIIKEDSFFE
jgi:hypothetical protein